MKLTFDGQDPRNLALAHCRHGTFLFSRNDLLGQFLDLYGEWAVPEIELLCSLIQPGDVVVDVGANIGADAVPLAHRVGPHGRVWAFEPQLFLYEQLCANALLNNASAILPCRTAVGDRSGRLRMPAVDYGHSGNFSALSLAGVPIDPAGKGGSANLPSDQVDCVRLDEVLADSPTVRLIKIDVEGMEISVLEGAVGLIERCRPLLYFELNREETGDALIARVRSLGYRLYWHVFRGFNPENYNRNAYNPFGLLGDVNALAVPEEMAFDPPDLIPIENFASVYRLFPGILGSEGRLTKLKRLSRKLGSLFNS